MSATRTRRPAATGHRRSGPLTADETVEVARRLLAEGGADALTMRRLAAELDVNPMTIYQRFENKDALLRAIAADVFDGIDLPDAEGTWVEQVVDLAVAIRARLLQGPGVALGAAALADLPTTVLRLTDRGLTLMGEIGLTGVDAVDAFRSVFWVAVGSALADASMAELSTTTTADALAAVADQVPTYAAHRSHFGAIDRDALFRSTITHLAMGMTDPTRNRR